MPSKNTTAGTRRKMHSSAKLSAEGICWGEKKKGKSCLPRQTSQYDSYALKKTKSVQVPTVEKYCRVIR